MPLLEPYRDQLAELSQIGRQRALHAPSGRDFASNDHLGLANSPRVAEAVRNALVRGVPVGSGGSRLLRGNHAEHVQLEEEAAAFFGM